MGALLEDAKAEADLVYAAAVQAAYDQFNTAREDARRAWREATLAAAQAFNASER